MKLRMLTLKQLLTAVALLTVTTGCATHEKFVKRYNSWLGQNIVHFVAQEGYPDSTFTLPNKHKVYVYQDSRIYSVPRLSPFLFDYYGRYGGFAYGSDVVQETCKLFIETDEKGKIVKWGSRGNACRA